jgi:hypothetical protein
MTGKKETITLYDYADSEEGIVETRRWWCIKERCAHGSHDAAFNYFVTLIEGGEVLWEGEHGEQIVKSPLGRWFYTRYEPDELDDPYAPWMTTRELEVEEGGTPVIPLDLWDTLTKRYGSWRHKVLLSLAKIAKVQPPQE